MRYTEHEGKCRIQREDQEGNGWIWMVHTIHVTKCVYSALFWSALGIIRVSLFSVVEGLQYRYWPSLVRWHCMALPETQASCR